MDDAAVMAELRSLLGQLLGRLDVVDRLGDFMGEVASLRAEIEQAVTVFGQCQATVAEHKRILEGSNGEGLKTRVSLLEQSQEGLAVLIEEARGVHRKAAWLSVESLVRLVVGAAIGAMAIKLALG